MKQARVLSIRWLISIALLFATQVLFCQDRISTWLEFSPDGLLLTKTPPIASYQKSFIDAVGKDQIDGIEILVPVATLKQEEDSIENGFSEVRSIFDHPDRADYGLLQDMLDPKVFQWLADAYPPDEADIFPTDPTLYPTSLKSFADLLHQLVSYANPTDIHFHKDNSEYYLMIKGIPDPLYPAIEYDESSKTVKFKFNFSKIKAIKHFIAEKKLIEYTIYRKSMLKEACISWYNHLNHSKTIQTDVLIAVTGFLIANTNHFTDIKKLDEQVKVAKELDDDVQRIAAGKKIDIALQTVLGDATNNLNTQPYKLTQISTVSYWIASWLWLSGKSIKINPFSFTSPDQLKKQDTTQLSGKVKYLKRSTDSSATKAASTRVPEEMANFDVLNGSLFDQSQQLQTGRQTIQNDTVIKQKYVTFQKTAYSLYKGYLLFSYSKHAKGIMENFRNYYDSAQNTLPVRVKQKQNYPETENIFIAYHNLPAGSKVIFTGNYSSIIEKSTVTNFWESNMDSTSLTSFFSNIAGTVLDLSNVSATAQQTKQVTADLSADLHAAGRQADFYDAIDQNTVKIQTFQHKLAIGSADLGAFIQKAAEEQLYKKKYYELLFGLSKALPIPTSLKAADDSVPNYMTQIFQVSPPKPAPVSYSYKVSKITKKDTSVIDTSSFSIGKRYRFRLAIGIEYTVNEVSQVTADTTGGKFQINNSYTPLHTVVMMRLYPFHGLYLQDLSFRPRDLVTRTSLMIGLGFPNPLDNYYVGAGLDILPGLTISGGDHFNRLNTYAISSDQVIRQGSLIQNRGFVSISVDPELFINIFKAL